MENEKKLIVLVDDNPTNLKIGKTILSEKYTVATAPSAEKMFYRLENTTPAMILLDIDMPQMDGLEAIRILKSNPETKDIPVIFLTARTELGAELEGLSLGAVDYILKPFQPALLLKRIEVHLLVEIQRKTLEKQAVELQYFNDYLRKAFSTYLSGDVVEEIIADPTNLQLGGVQQHMTAMFTDIKNFSHVSEKLNPTELVSLLNHYLSAMSNTILEQKGTIDKYEGDAIIAFFGAPLLQPDHAILACSSAIAMKKLEEEMNHKFAEQGISPSPLYTRIGINTGDMVVGNMGTEQKMNYTIMGNAVNVASRLEGVNKYYGTWILASEETVRETKGRFLTRQFDRIRVAGINEPIRVHEVLETDTNASAALCEMADLFQKAHDLFESRSWKDAQDEFEHVLKIFPDDSPSLLYLDHCRKFLQNPPPEEWDGVFDISKK